MALRVPPEPLWYLFPIDRFHAKLAEAVGDMPIEFTSWYRDPDKNADAGGERYSQHLAGLAKDAVGQAEPLRVLATRARGLGYVAVLESDHLHIQMYTRGYLEHVWSPNS